MRKIFFITLPTVIALLIVSEFSLRLYSHWYAEHRHPGTYVEPKALGKDEFRILCLGDSFTWGFGAGPGRAYPDQLEDLLQKGVSEKISVVNGGLLANTSSLLSKKLEADILKYSPSVIVVMIGISNNWNLEGSSYFLLYGNSLSFSKRLGRFLSTLSFYKLLRIASEKFKTKTDASLEKPSREGPESIQEAQLIKLRIMGDRLLREGKNDLAIETARRALEIDSTDLPARLILAQTLFARLDYPQAREELWRAIRSV